MIADTKRRFDELEWRKDFVVCAACIMTEDTRDRAVQKAQHVKNSAAGGMMTKAAQSAATLGTSGLSDFGPSLNAFMRTLRNTVFERISAAAFPMPLNQGRVIIASQVSSSTVAEGKPKPVRPVMWLQSDVDPVKVASLIVLSKELIDGLGDAAMTILGDELKSAIVAGQDAELLSSLSANSTEAPSADQSLTGFLIDFQELISMVDAGAGSRLFLILHPDTCKALSVALTAAGVTTLGWNGGTLAGIEVLCSDQQTARRLTLVDATGLAIAAAPITLQRATQATLQMDNAPSSHSSDVPEAVNQVNLFQTNSVALLVERSIAIEPIRNNSYAHLTDAAFPNTGESPTG
jgi:hypothetical protein